MIIFSVMAKCYHLINKLTTDPLMSSCLGPSMRLGQFSFPPSCIWRPRRALSIMAKWFPWQSPALLDLLATQAAPYQLTASITSFSGYWSQMCYCRREGLYLSCPVTFFPSFITNLFCYFLVSFTFQFIFPLCSFTLFHSFILFGYFCWKSEWMFVFVEKSNLRVRGRRTVGAESINFIGRYFIL